jgi:hypothetical protein
MKTIGLSEATKKRGAETMRSEIEFAEMSLEIMRLRRMLRNTDSALLIIFSIPEKLKDTSIRKSIVEIFHTNADYFLKAGAAGKKR